MPDHAELVRDCDLAGLLERHAGNAREVLFALYDVYQARQRMYEAPSGCCPAGMDQPAEVSR
jgi:hypothetical protein